ncbi:hypothetical protein SCOR_25295 [Sulfidibacter corallicola]
MQGRVPSASAISATSVVEIKPMQFKPSTVVPNPPPNDAGPGEPAPRAISWLELPVPHVIEAIEQLRQITRRDFFDAVDQAVVG